MAVQIPLPTENLTFDDIRDTLNSGGGSVDDTVDSAFKTTSGINKWSAHKPIKLAVDFIEGADTKLATGTGSTSEWWKFNSCGLTLPTNSLGNGASTGSAAAKYLGWIAVQQGNNQNLNYAYTPPTGGSSQPMRLGDFRKYKADATPVFQTRIKGYSSGRWGALPINQLNYAAAKTITAEMYWDYTKREIKVADLMGGSQYFTVELYFDKKNDGTFDLATAVPSFIYHSKGTSDLPQVSEIGTGTPSAKYLDIPLGEALATMSTSDYQNKYMYVVLGSCQWSGTTQMEHTALMPHVDSSYGHIYKFLLYYEYPRKATPKQSCVQSGTDANFPYYTFGSNYPSTITSRASSFGVMVACEKTNTKYTVVSNASSSTSGEKVIFRFTPTNATGSAIQKQAKVVSGWGYTTATETTVAAGSGEQNVYLWFENCYNLTSDKSDKVISGFIEASNDGGNTWDALEGSNVILNINK